MRNAVASGLMATCIVVVAIHVNDLAGGDKGSGSDRRSGRTCHAALRQYCASLTVRCGFGWLRRNRYRRCDGAPCSAAPGRRTGCTGRSWRAGAGGASSATAGTWRSKPTRRSGWSSWLPRRRSSSHSQLSRPGSVSSTWPAAPGSRPSPPRAWSGPAAWSWAWISPAAWWRRRAGAPTCAGRAMPASNGWTRRGWTWTAHPSMSRSARWGSCTCPIPCRPCGRCAASCAPAGAWPYRPGESRHAAGWTRHSRACEPISRPTCSRHSSAWVKAMPSPTRAYRRDSGKWSPAGSPARIGFADDDEACRAGFQGGPIALAWSRLDEGARDRARSSFLAAIARWRHGRAYRIPAEFVVAVARVPGAGKWGALPDEGRAPANSN